MKWKNWLWGLAAVPVLCLPLIAQETKVPEPPPRTPAPTSVAQPQPAAAPAQEEPEPASQDKPEPADERMSADNNISFPVDI